MLLHHNSHYHRQVGQHIGSRKTASIAYFLPIQIMHTFNVNLPGKVAVVVVMDRALCTYGTYVHVVLDLFYLHDSVHSYQSLLENKIHITVHIASKLHSAHVFDSSFISLPLSTFIKCKQKCTKKRIKREARFGKKSHEKANLFTLIVIDPQVQVSQSILSQQTKMLSLPCARRRINKGKKKPAHRSFSPPK